MRQAMNGWWLTHILSILGRLTPSLWQISGNPEGFQIKRSTPLFLHWSLSQRAISIRECERGAALVARNASSAFGLQSLPIAKGPPTSPETLVVHNIHACLINWSPIFGPDYVVDTHGRIFLQETRFCKIVGAHADLRRPVLHQACLPPATIRH
jgi:hypothetical protein